MATLLESLQLCKIEPEDIIYLVREMGKRREEGNEVDFYTQIGILADKYSDGSDKPAVIMERMQCLIALMDEDRMRGWTIECPNSEAIFTSGAVFRATAIAPLHGDDKRLWFEPDEFSAIALAETPEEGYA